VNDPRLDGVVVLVVDDSPDALELVGHVLRSHGATVVTAERAVEALRIVEKSPPDVLLSDIGLPDMDGYQLLEEIRRLEERKRVTEHKDVHIPAAAITAFTDRDDVRKSMLAGYRFHIPKPVDFDELIETVASLAGRTGAVSSGDHA
jgi:CheY-like chemotaxis protein